jgi:hypothetical protein
MNFSSVVLEGVSQNEAPALASILFVFLKDPPFFPMTPAVYLLGMRGKEN